MKKPNIDDHLAPTGSNQHVDYIVKKDKNLEYKGEIISQFVEAISGRTVLFPNSSSHTQPFIMMVIDNGVKTQLVIYSDSPAEMDELKRKADAAFSKGY